MPVFVEIVGRTKFDGHLVYIDLKTDLSGYVLGLYIGTSCNAGGAKTRIENRQTMHATKKMTTKDKARFIIHLPGRSTQV
jgi:hypothetical protein